jgi:hypothetical protein
MTMIKNNSDIFEQNESYVFIITNEIKFSSDKEDSSTYLKEQKRPPDCFAEFIVRLEFLIPNRNELAHRIRLYDSFYIDINEDNRYEIRNNDKNNSYLQVINYPAVDIYDVSNADIGENNDVYMCDLKSSSFKNFVLNESFKEVYKYFNRIDEIFAEKVEKQEKGGDVVDRTILNKNVLNEVKHSFQSMILEFVEQFNSSELDLLTKKYPENVSITDLKDLYEVIREAEIAHKRKKLYEHLVDKLYEDAELFKDEAPKEPKKSKI